MRGENLSPGGRIFVFNRTMIERLNKGEMRAPPQRTSGEESFDMVVPAMKVRDFNFSSLTKF